MATVTITVTDDVKNAAEAAGQTPKEWIQAAISKTLAAAAEDAEQFKTYTVKEASRLIGLSERSVGDKIRAGVLKASKIGTQWRVTPENLKKFVDGE